MILQKMVDSVSDNLGKRSSGRIGSSAVSSVVLDAINVAIPHIMLEAQPDYYNRTCEIAIDTTNKEYALPTQDSDGNTIRIKDIHGFRCYQVGGTENVMDQVTYKRFVELTRDYHQDIVARPRYFALWGTANKLHIDTISSETLTLELFVSVHPTVLLEGNLGESIPIDSQWNLIVESFATAYCCMKLQQSQQYIIWNDLYLKQKASVSRDENRKHSRDIAVGQRQNMVSDPALDPFQRSWN